MLVSRDILGVKGENEINLPSNSSQHSGLKILKAETICTQPEIDGRHVLHWEHSLTIYAISVLAIVVAEKLKAPSFLQNHTY